MIKGNALLDDDNTILNDYTPHGGCYTSGSVATTITLAGTFYPLAGTSTALDASLFTHSSPGRLTYNGTITKFFLVSAKFSIISNSNNIIVRTRLAKSGTTDVSSEQTQFKGTGADVVGFVTMSFIQLAQNDYIEMYITCDNAGATITANQCVILIVPI